MPRGEGGRDLGVAARGEILYITEQAVPTEALESARGLDRASFAGFDDFAPSAVQYD